jgi:uncharacterized protein
MMERSGILLPGKKTLFAIVCFLFFQNILFAQIEFPELTGRVVDNAKILSQEQENSLSSILEAHEKKSSNQIVIVTLNSLKGYDIADFGYQLGRHWSIGQKEKNNGVLLIVSMAEKKIRIEVGYGLEGALSDKTAHEIIEYIIKPKFKQGNFYNGISEGINTIIKAIKGEYKATEYNVLSNSSENFFFVYFAIIFLSGMLKSAVRKVDNKTLPKIFHSSMLSGFAGAFAIAFFNSFLVSLIIFIITFSIIFIFTKKVSYSNSSSSSWGSSGSRSGGFSSGGGFSGGGGSFGGGGASGGW